MGERKPSGKWRYNEQNGLNELNIGEFTLTVHGEDFGWDVYGPWADGMRSSFNEKCGMTDNEDESKLAAEDCLERILTDALAEIRVGKPEGRSIADWQAATGCQTIAEAEWLSGKYRDATESLRIIAERLDNLLVGDSLSDAVAPAVIAKLDELDELRKDREP